MTSSPWPSTPAHSSPRNISSGPSHTAADQLLQHDSERVCSANGDGPVATTAAAIAAATGGHPGHLCQRRHGRHGRMRTLGGPHGPIEEPMTPPEKRASPRKVPSRTPSVLLQEKTKPPLIFEGLRVDETNQTLHARLQNYWKLTLIFGARGAQALASQRAPNVARCAVPQTWSFC